MITSLIPPYEFVGSSLTGWTLVQPNGSVTASNGVITLNDTGGSATMATYDTPVLKQSGFIYDNVIDNPNGNYASIVFLDATATAVFWLIFKNDGTILNNVGAGGTYTPLNWNPLLKYRIRVSYDSRTRICVATLLYIDATKADDEGQVHLILASLVLTAQPVKVRFQTSGGLTGTLSYSEISVRELGYVTIGDSTCSGSGDSSKDGEWNPVPGWKASNVAEMAFAYWFQKRIGLTCTNYGVASLPMSRAVGRLGPWVAVPKQGVIFSIGTNDIKEGRALEQMVSDFTTMVNAFYPAPVFVLEVLPRNAYTAQENELMAAWNGWLATHESLGYKLLRTRYYFEDRVNRGQINSFLSDDGTHPNIAGHRLLSAIISKAIP